MNNTDTDIVDPVELVPIGLIAAEIGLPLDELARRLADDVTFDDIGLSAVAVDVARTVIVEHRERQLIAAATTGRNQEVTEELAEQYRPRLSMAPSATALAELGYSSPQEYMAAQMAAEVEAAGSGRRHVFEDALGAGGDLVYRPIRDGGDQ